MTLSAVVIGCGKIGSEFADDPRVAGIFTHAGAYAACQDVSLKGVGDTNAEKARKAGQRWDAPVYTDIGKLLQETRPEMVSVCTPDETHAEVLEQVLQTPSVRAVWMEKPLALDLNQAESLVQKAEKNGVLLSVNYFRRYAPGYQAIKRLLDSGEMGPIQAVSGWYTKGTLHNGTHWFDLLRYLAGDVSKAVGFDFLQEGGEDPTLDAVLSLQSGAGAHLQACRAEAFSVFEMDIMTTLGRLKFVDNGLEAELWRSGDSPHYSGYKSLASSERRAMGLGEAMPAALQELLQCVKTKKAPLSSGREALAAMRIAWDVRSGKECLRK